ncbi:MAG: 50S ribosomal protein L24 [Candidatus Zipacnadales bacterium]
MPTVKLHVKKGDEVQVISGHDRSKKGRLRRGRVIQVYPRTGYIIVDGINIRKKAQRQSQKIRQGGIIDVPGRIHVSNVMLVCPNCDAPNRPRRERRESGVRIRVCRKCKKDIDTE